jgi:hypothetical protein
MSSNPLISLAEANFLNLQQLPACLNVEQTAALLGRRPEHIPILIEGGFLKPLGDPPKNGIKLFAACDILEKSKDVKWLDKSNRYLTRHWQNRNGRTKSKDLPSSRQTTTTVGESSPDARTELKLRTGSADQPDE